MMSSIYRALADLETQDKPGVLCTIVKSQGSTPRHVGSKMLIYADGRTLGSVGGGELESRVLGEAGKVLLDSTPRLLAYNMSEPERGDPGVCGGQVEVFLEPIQPRPLLVVIGAGHVGRAVVHLASWLGFKVAVSDDRAEFASPESTPGADDYYPVTLAELTSHLEITPWTYLILTTRGVDIDVPGLPALLDSPAAFIGVIGSKRRWATTRQQLLEAGLPPEKLERVRSPVGIELHAETPEEIAVSIMAEIIQLRRAKSGA